MIPSVPLAAKTKSQRCSRCDNQTSTLSRHLALARTMELTSDVFAACERFAAALHKHPEEQKIDVTRYRVSCSSSGPSSSLPPTQDALFKHCQCAAYQAAVWKLSCEAKPDVPHPSGHGWSVASAANCEV